MAKTTAARGAYDNLDDTAHCRACPGAIGERARTVVCNAATSVPAVDEFLCAPPVPAAGDGPVPRRACDASGSGVP